MAWKVLAALAAVAAQAALGDARRAPRGNGLTVDLLGRNIDIPDTVPGQPNRIFTRQETPVHTEPAPKPNKLKPWKPLHEVRRRHRGMARRDIRDVFRLRSKETLWWRGDDDTTARFEIDMPGDDENLVTLEDIDDLVTKVVCPPPEQNGELLITFQQAADFDDAEDIWKWVDQEERNHFYMIVGAGLCGDNDERLIYNVTSLGFNDEHETATLNVEATTWEKAVHSYDLTFGQTIHAVTPGGNLQRRDGEGFTVPLDASMTGMSIVIPGPVSITASCVECYTKGFVRVTGHFRMGFFKMDEANIEVSSDGIDATSVVRIGVKANITSAFGTEVPLVEIPLTPFYLPGIITMGPVFNVKLGAEIGAVDVGVGITVGAHARMKPSFARLDFLDEARTTSQGWDVEFTTDPVHADFFVETSAAVFLKASLGLEFSVLSTGFVAEIYANVPKLRATLKISGSTTCNVCENYAFGLSGGIALSTSIGAQLSGKVFGSMKPLFGVSFAEASWPLVDFCQGFGPSAEQCQRAMAW